MWSNLVDRKSGLAFVLQAFQKLDKEKKRQELEKIRETYGISKDKWSEKTVQCVFNLLGT